MFLGEFTFIESSISFVIYLAIYEKDCHKHELFQKYKFGIAWINSSLAFYMYFCMYYNQEVKDVSKIPILNYFHN